MIEISQGSPVMDNLGEARVYFGSGDDPKNLKTSDGSKLVDQDEKKDLTDSFELDEETLK